MRGLPQIALLLALLVAAGASAQSPHGEAMTIDCALCHSPAGWTNPTLIWSENNKAVVLKHKGRSRSDKQLVNATAQSVVFQHDSTGFTLEGQHAKVDCRSCHVSLVFAEASSECVSCHTDVHAMSVGDDCVRCHTSTDWLVNNIPELHEQNGFALVGAHGNLSCVDCHTNGNTLQFDRVGNDCVSCHQSDYLATTSPNHNADGFSTDCIACHDPMGNGWQTDIVDHSFFPLTQGHAIQDCNQCHTTGNYSDASPECVTCHQQEYATTTNPNHQEAGFPTDCALCHTTGPGWTPANFDHSIWPPQGGHIPVSCDQCHQGNYQNTPTSCESCHLTDYNSTTDPNHVTEGFPTDCAMCHDEGSWNSSTFDHNTTAFPLTGQHVNAACIDCHSNGYTGTPTNCDACHQTDFNNTVEPNHTQAQFSNDCAQCHTTDGWTPSSFDHASTGWALNGSHQNVNCNQCHANGYAGTPTACESCHLTDYNSTTDPNHVTAGFPTDCAMCHDEGSWNSTTFDHNTTAFPLTGAHVPLNCLECHAEGFAGTPTACDACHLGDYNTTTDPNHAQAMFPTDCAICHATSAWVPATFDHANTGFPLVGAHMNANCNQCHTNGYSGTPTNCDACHMPDYNSTTDPNHGAEQLPLDCAMCHSESAWVPSTFDHDQEHFPIYSGTHNNEWNQCSECHTTPGNYAVYSCIDCHEHDNQTQVNNDHSEVNGYSYNSIACYSCHPNGN